MRQPTITSRIVLVTDRGMFGPTLFTAWTLLRRLRGPGELHFWGDGLDPSDWGVVRAIGNGNPAVTLHCLPLSAQDMAGSKGFRDHISAAAMGRLLIPSKLTGRVLYLDGDIRVTGDVSPLFSLDMQGKPIAAVRDYVVSKRCALGRDSHRRRLATVREQLQDVDFPRYFNSGVLLIDTDAVRADSALLAAMQDVVRASTYDLGDQDHLNAVFTGKVHLLNPCYNSSWQRTGDQRQFAGKLGGDAAELARLPDALVHFHGARKPWKARRLDLWSRRARAVWAFRRELSLFQARFPDLSF